MSIVPKWKSLSEIHAEGLKYIQQRRDGSAKSLRTPWSKFNDAGIDGFEWGNIITIGGRPASGKTLIVNQITRNAHALNPDQDFAVLDFQFEMSARTTAVREFSQVMKKTYKQLVSVDYRVSDYEMELMVDHAKQVQHRDIYQIEDPMTVEEIEHQVIAFAKQMQKPIVVTIDHSILVKKCKDEKDVFATLYSLGEMMTKVKKMIPVIFIVLTQMNRSIEEQSRKIPGSVSNYPTTADVFGADALYMHSDILIAINRPFYLNIPIYGPERFEVDKDTLALHFLKTRNGENSLCFFKAMFEHMMIEEMETPDTQQLSMRTTGQRRTI